MGITVSITMTMGTFTLAEGTHSRTRRRLTTHAMQEA